MFNESTEKSKKKENFKDELLDYNNEPLIKFERFSSKSKPNYDSVENLTKVNSETFGVGKYIKLPTVLTKEATGTEKRKSSQSKYSRNSTSHDSNYYYITNKNAENRQAMSAHERPSLKEDQYSENQQASNFFHSDRSVSSLAITADEDLDNISYSSDDTVDLISQARDYYMEDEEASENMKVLLTESRYHSSSFDPTRLNLTNAAFAASSLPNSKTPSIKTPYFKIERLDEEPDENNDEGFLKK